MSKSGPKSASTLSKDQQLIAKALSDWVLPQIGQPAAAYPGQQVPNLLGGYGQVSQNLQGMSTPDFSQYSNSLQGLLGAQTPGNLQGGLDRLMNPGGMNSRLEQGISQLLSGKSNNLLDEKRTNQYFTNAIEKPAMESFQQNIKPQIELAFAGLGGFSSRKGAEQAKALGNMNTALMSQRSQVQMENQRLNAQMREAAMNRVAQGVQLGTGLQGLNSSNLAQGLQLGNQMNQGNLANQAQGIQLGSSLQSQSFGQGLTLQQAIMSALAPQQERLDLQAQSGYNEFQRMQPVNSPFNQLALSILGGQHTQLYTKPSPFGGALTGGIGGLMAGASMGLFPPFGLALGAAGALAGGLGR